MARGWINRVCFGTLLVSQLVLSPVAGFPAFWNVRSWANFRHRGAAGGSREAAKELATRQQNHNVIPPAEDAPFIRALTDFMNQNMDWNLTIYPHANAQDETYTLSQLRDKKGFFKCDYIIYHTMPRASFEQPDIQLLLRHQAEWNADIPNQCLMILHRSTAKYLRSDLVYYDRYPAGTILIGLIKTGVIETVQSAEPWILYNDVDFYYAVKGMGVASIVQRLERGARPEKATMEMSFCKDTESFTCDAPATPGFDDIDYVITNDVACDLRISWRRHRLNSGAQLFRPRPMAAFLLDATLRAYQQDVAHPYPSNDQGFLTWVVQTAFSFNFDRLNFMCRDLADDTFWKPACQGDSLVVSRYLNEEGIDSATFLQEAAALWLQPAAHFSIPDAQTSLALSRSAMSGSRNPRAVAVVCIRWMQSTGCELEDYWAKYRGQLVQNLFGWRCGDFAAHFMGCTKTKSEVFMRKKWRNNIVKNDQCRDANPLLTNNDGTPFTWDAFADGK